MKLILFSIWCIVAIIMWIICSTMISAACAPANVGGLIIFIIFIAISLKSECFTKNIFKK